MSKKIAIILSAIGHPVLLFIYVYFITIIANPLYGWVSMFYSSVLLLFFVLFACGIVYLLYKLNYIHSLHPKAKNERIIIYLVFIIVFFFYFQFLSRTVYAPFVNLFLIITLLALSVLVFITYFWNISGYLYLWGCAIGYCLGIGLISGINYLFPVIILLLFSGLLASARLRLRINTLSQVCLSFLIGFLPLIILFLVI
jgi:hypothetical protein